MDYAEQIETIVSDESCDNKRKVDLLLKLDCSMYTTLGTDSSDEERGAIKALSSRIYQAISNLDEDVGRMLLSGT
jgi:hypothetical protein